ncbi:hypothetical protein ABZY58_11855 [Micromonospora tulbaghiae]|uniref:hypothetical protein n=1 Tax=Micromonospora tulbaghiae TaxID=479978 RepID=UPI00339DD5DE
MATPVIRSVTTTPGSVQPGQAAQVAVDAFDPDAREVVMTAKVTDSAGNAATAVTKLTVGDPLTYELTTDDPGVTITPDSSEPGRFTVSVTNAA